MKELIKQLVESCKISNAAETKLICQRDDGYIVSIVVRKQGAHPYYEFNEGELHLIRQRFKDNPDIVDKVKDQLENLKEIS